MSEVVMAEQRQKDTFTDMRDHGYGGLYQGQPVSQIEPSNWWATDRVTADWK